MPPTCCTSDHIPLRHVEKLFSDTFKKKWNKKYHEYTTKNRVYCPARGCGEWIKPADIHLDLTGGANGGRRYGKCGRCKTKVCCTCNGKWHTSRECPKDEETKRFVEVAKEQGWQRCFNCSAMVELREGCNHMTCRCRAEFCMICALRWKTCDCPWFTYEAVAADRLQHHHDDDVPAGRMPNVPAPAPGYQEELHRRREQERTDEALARRMQNLGVYQDQQEQPDLPPRRPRRRFRFTPSIAEAHDAERAAERAADIAAHMTARDPTSPFYPFPLPAWLPQPPPHFGPGPAPAPASFINTRPPPHHQPPHPTPTDAFLHRARALMTGPPTGPHTETAARALVAEYATAHPGVPRPPPLPIPMAHHHPCPATCPHHRHPNAPTTYRGQTTHTHTQRRDDQFSDNGSQAAARRRPATGVAGGTTRAAAGLTRRTGRVEEWRSWVDVEGDPSLGPDRREAGSVWGGEVGGRDGWSGE